MDRKVNQQVVCLSNPANYFHALRRQVFRDYRTPLIAFTSKKLLKYKGAVSPMKDIGEGTSFRPIIDETEVSQVADPVNVKKVAICSG